MNSRKRKRTPHLSGREPTEDETYHAKVKGTMNSDSVEEESKKEVLKIEKKLKKKVKEEFNEEDVMPLDYELELAYRRTTEPNAEKDDKKYYRDEVFHFDEQKDKTEELQNNGGDAYGLQGLVELDDPGYYPPIEYEYNGEAKPPIAKIFSEKSGKDFFIFPLTWDQIGDDWTIVVVGKRRSGKTCFIKSMCGNRLRPFFPRVVVFTKTKCSGEYAKFIPEAHIHEGLNEDMLNSLFTMQKKYRMLQKEGKMKGNISLLIIIDDCLSDNLKYKKVIDEVFFEGRHLGICIIISTQDIKGINPACTSNADLAVCFNLRSERDKEAMRTKFCDFFKNDEEMEALTSTVLHRKWHVVCFDQHLPHRDPRFTVFGGRAPPAPPFVMGCAAWWRKNIKQLAAIVNENPELTWLLYTDNWGVFGEQEFNQIM